MRPESPPPRDRPPHSASARECRRRLLFLDDDPARAAQFLEEHPAAIWVQTVEECLEQLGGCWEEVHLDHDLGGEIYVDPGRDDCGMAVVRWLGLENRPHLKATRFFVHSHNLGAARTMVLHLRAMGYLAEARPFLSSNHEPAPDAEEGRRASDRGWLRWLRGLVGREPRLAPKPE